MENRFFFRNSLQGIESLPGIFLVIHRKNFILTHYNGTSPGAGNRTVAACLYYFVNQVECQYPGHWSPVAFSMPDRAIAELGRYILTLLNIRQ